jgi:hypothetical protein
MEVITPRFGTAAEQSQPSAKHSSGVQIMRKLTAVTVAFSLTVAGQAFAGEPHVPAAHAPAAHVSAAPANPSTAAVANAGKVEQGYSRQTITPLPSVSQNAGNRYAGK